MIRRIICATSIIVFSSSILHAVEKKTLGSVTVSDVVRETQVQRIIRNEGGNVSIHLAWWLPVEYWEAAARSGKALSESAIKRSIDNIRPYFMLAVISADISPFGSFDFYPSDIIVKQSKFEYIDKNGKSHNLVPILDPEENVKLMLQAMKPSLAATLGKLGRNFNFLAFSDKDAKGNRILSPYNEGVLKISLKDRKGNNTTVLQIDTLLDSLHVPRKCANGRNAHVSWKYCPWDGKPLEK